jgi:hypothetical protein
MGSPAAGIYICIRRTLDWRDAARVRAGVLPEFRPKLEAWNATFDLPYHRFRERLTEIARLSLARVEGAACVSLEAVPPGGLIVPVDDDDWFAPQLAQRLRKVHDPSLHGYRWKRHVIEPLRRRRGPLRFVSPLRPARERFTCATNNYAVKNLPELAGFATAHTRASEYFDAQPSRVRRIAGFLAVQNRSLASQTALAWRRPGITRDELVAAFERYRDLYAGWRLPRGLGWARPYVERMAELMAEIELR